MRSVSQKRTRTRTMLRAATGSRAAGWTLMTGSYHSPALRCAAVAAKRRLPVLQEPPGDDPDAPPRPAWQWVGFGALGIVVVWLPLAAVTSVLVLWWGGPIVPPLAQAVLFAGGLALAAMAGGYLLGRWGTRGVGVREAALAGLSASAAAGALASMGMALPLRLLVTRAAVMVATPPATLGGRLGMKKRSGAW